MSLEAPKADSILKIEREILELLWNLILLLVELEIQTILSSFNALIMPENKKERRVSVNCIQH